ncbi:phage tail protein [Microvirga splendida]|uniref:Phage tail protein n=1 Tax=Microvirga splendida TaxID=2795727 RepID=A0ABS0Y4G5_9HYPH|nr:phage tail protein [Microvirga splendida]MBJ6127198.1 hypothetical protein [Microvirga splendida]
MTSANAYRFASAAHWERCLATGFDSLGDGKLGVAARLNPQAQLVADGAADAVAADRLGQPFWRGGNQLRRLDDFGQPGPSAEVDGLIAGTPRLQLARDWLWAFDAGSVARFDRPTLQLDRCVTSAAISRWLGVGEVAVAILDIAADAKGGVWLLARTRGKALLVHMDCDACISRTIDLPCEFQDADQIAVTDSLVALLSIADQRLTLLAAADAKVVRSQWLGNWCGCWRAERIAGDARRRLALAGAGLDPTSGSVLFRLDGLAEIVDGPLKPELAVEKKTKPLRVDDLAVGANSLWLATPDGLCRLDEGGGASEAISVIQTPLLQSPVGEQGRGWLHAEIDMDLPKSASISASFASTNDPRIAAEIRAIEGDTSLSQSDRLERVWSLLDTGQASARAIVLPGRTVPSPLSPNDPMMPPLAVPLFDTSDGWLALRLKVTVPPEVQPPTLRELRVLYPERSLMAYLPAIYSDPENDPERLLRRIVGVIETTTQQIDRSIASIGSRLDARTAPTEMLDYLGSWLKLPWHSGLEEWSKRQILGSAGVLLAWRGSRRGLAQLLACLAGEGGHVELLDVMAERSAIRLGGRGQAGSPVNGLLAGLPPATASLGGKAVLGRARLACRKARPGPTDILVPTVLIKVEASAATIARNRPYADSVLSQYLPAGVRHRIAWTATPPRTAEDTDALMILDGNGPGEVGGNARLGRMVLGGGPHSGMDDGLEMGLRLR